jgi:DNA-binding NtrC family response regulator
MKLGAWDFLPKPIDQTELLRLVEQADASRRQTLEAEGSRRARERQTSVRIVAESEAMKNVLRLAETVAASGSTTVLINGETGVGKEVVARHIHATSPRANAPMHALKCTALPEHLVENELFGHDKRKGLFELADGGTVVLDEISEIPLTLQAKLLRFLEERTFRRLGGTREIAVDVRVLALTSRSLEQRVARSLFREDLFSRLNVFPLTVPPLRERRDDILPLALGFAVQYGAASGKRFTAVAPELQARLLAHPWSGNVRELRNVIERATILEPGPLLNGHSIALQEKIATFEATEDEPIVPLDEVEFVMVRRALRAASGNQSKAARLLQVSRDQLRYRLKRYRDEGRMIEGEE